MNCHVAALTSLKGLLSPLDHLLPSYTCPVHLNTIIRYSSLIRLYDCVLPCLFKYHLLVKQCIFFYFVSGWLIKSVISLSLILYACVLILVHPGNITGLVP